MAPAWIAVDWGTTNLRVWAMGVDDSVLAEDESGSGMGGLTVERFEPALLSLVSGWLSDERTIPVIACGMVGARQGWIEAPYRAVPCAPLAAPLLRVPDTDARIEVWIVPGLMQTDPADVMRGEETQIAGLLAQRPGFEGAICQPGTHTKWATVSGGAVTGFTSVMTGEMFSLLEKQSMLRHSFSEQGFDQATFERVVTEALDDPARTLSRLFSIRAGDLLKGVPSDVSRATLSAILIASEIGAMQEKLVGSDVVLVGSRSLVGLYAKALRAAGFEPTIADGKKTTLDGLIAAKGLMENTL